MNPDPTPTRTQRSTVHFSITGEFMTKQARDFWREAEYGRAFELLDCCIGINREQQEQIIQGTAKLEGVNKVFIVPDSWEPDDREYYPTLLEALRRGSDYDAYQDLRQVEAIRLLSEVAKINIDPSYATGEDSANAQQMLWKAEKLIGEDDAAKLLKDFEAELDDDFEAEMNRTRPQRIAQVLQRMHNDRPEPRLSGLDLAVAMASNQMQIAAMQAGTWDPSAQGPSPDAILWRGSKLQPTVCKDMSSQNGWILPDGTYYGCGAMEHVGLAANILAMKGLEDNDQDSEKTAENLGWIKIARAAFGFHIIGRKAPTRKQKDAIFDYCEYHKRDYETTLEELSLTQSRLP